MGGLITVGLLVGSAVTVGAQDVVYLITEDTTSFEHPNVSSAVIRHYRSFETVMVEDAEPGWIQIKSQSDTGQPGGWIQAVPENLIPDNALATTLRIVELREKPWSDAVKFDIIRQRFRTGFSREQVELALDPPLTVSKGVRAERRIVETADGRVEMWSYPGQVIEFKDGTVTRIDTVEIS